MCNALALPASWLRRTSHKNNFWDRASHFIVGFPDCVFLCLFKEIFIYNQFLLVLMEMNVLEESPKKIVFELKGETHSFCNALKDALLGNSHVKLATYIVKHPLVGQPQFTVETDGTAKPKKVLGDAAEKLGKEAAELRKVFVKKVR